MDWTREKETRKKRLARLGKRPYFGWMRGERVLSSSI